MYVCMYVYIYMCGIPMTSPKIRIPAFRSAGATEPTLPRWRTWFCPKRAVYGEFVGNVGIVLEILYYRDMDVVWYSRDIVGILQGYCRDIVGIL